MSSVSDDNASQLFDDSVENEQFVESAVFEESATPPLSTSDESDATYDDDDTGDDEDDDDDNNAYCDSYDEDEIDDVHSKTCQPPATSSASHSAPSNVPDEISIFFMTWNTESVLIAETLQRSGHETLSFTSQTVLGCNQPDFLPELISQHIFKEHTDNPNPHHLLVVALQESAKPGDYFLSDALGKELGNRYTLVHRGRVIGVGRTTVNALKRNATLRMRGLRMAIFARRDFFPLVHFVAQKKIACTMQDNVTRGKTGYGIVLRIDYFGLCGFLDVHLPFSASTVRKSNHERLISGVREQNTAFCRVLKSFLKGRSLHHFFVLGDLNYRVMHFENTINAASLCEEICSNDEFRRRVYLTQDELKHAIDTKALPLPFCEGVDNRGPEFMPTAKMQHGRSPGDTRPSAYKFGKTNARNPGWCDRILYLPGSLQGQRTIAQILSAAEKGEPLAEPQYRPAQCTYYNRFESGATMTLSDHSAVCAYYTIKRS